MAVIRTSKVDLKVNGSGAYAFVAQPDDDTTHPGVVLIQEWWGIESHIIDLAQKLATEGFVVAVPDLYHGQVVTEPNEAQKAIMMLVNNVDRAVGESVGALETLKTNPSVSPKKLGVMGFCVGGFLAWTVASRYTELGAVATFYGAGYDPSPQDVAKVNAPVLAIYGSKDQSISQQQIDKIEKLYKDAGKDISVKVYDAGHAFINPDHGMGDEASAKDAWPKAVRFLKDHLK